MLTWITSFETVKRIGAEWFTRFRFTVPHKQKINTLKKINYLLCIWRENN